MMNKFISLLGSNATGKSTRMTEYVSSLGEPDKILDYHYRKNGEDLVVRNAGYIYGTTIVVGSRGKNGKWRGGDHTVSILGSQACVKEFFEHLDHIGMETVVYEAYYAAAAKLFRPNQLREYFLESHTYWFLYDTLAEYVERTEARTGRNWAERGKDPEKTSGWKTNVHSYKVVEHSSLEAEGSNCTVERVSVYAPRDWLVEEMKKYNL